jgi:hypothetical protein
MQNKKNKEPISTDKLIYNVIMFILIFALMISFIFTIDKLFFSRPELDCNLEKYGLEFRDPSIRISIENCTHNTDFIENCYRNEGQIIYKEDCEIECNYCYKEYSSRLREYNNTINLGRMIFTFILALGLAFIKINDKIIRSSLLSANLVAMFIATISALNILGRIVPLIIIAEFLLVIFIYKKTSKERLEDEKNEKTKKRIV